MLGKRKAAALKELPVNTGPCEQEGRRPFSYAVFPKVKRVPWQQYRPMRLTNFDFVGKQDQVHVAAVPPTFKNLKFLDGGTFGSVVAAQVDEETAERYGGVRDVVVKVIDCTTDVMAESAIRELHNLIFFTMKSPHENIIKMLDCWFAMRKLHVVLPRYTCTVQTLIDNFDATGMSEGTQKQPCLPQPARQSLAIQLFKAIRHLHAYGIVHRDIKPGNIVVSCPDIRSAAVIDLGSLRKPSAAVDVGPPLTPAKDCMTRGYLPPETLAGSGSGYSKEVDNFAVGLILTEIVTGDDLFERYEVEAQAPTLRLEKNRRAFVKDLLKGYECVGDAEINRITALLAAHPAARATASQAIRNLCAVDEGSRVRDASDDFYDSINASDYQEPSYDFEDLEAMTKHIQDLVARARSWFNQ